MSELLNVVDENNNFTGEIKKRTFIHEKGLWHREVACWIMNSKRRIIITKKSIY